MRRVCVLPAYNFIPFWRPHKVFLVFVSRRAFLVHYDGAEIPPGQGQKDLVAIIKTGCFSSEIFFHSSIIFFLGILPDKTKTYFSIPRPNSRAIFSMSATVGRHKKRIYFCQFFSDNALVALDSFFRRRLDDKISRPLPACPGRLGLASGDLFRYF